MKLIISILIIVLGHTSLSAQDLETRLQKNSKVDCSVYAENSSELIGSYDIEQLDSVTAVLDIWERECGLSEPIMRMRILHDIYFNRFRSEHYTDYYQLYIRKYIYRVEASQRRTYHSNYESSKNYYDHTRIGQGFDHHTFELAKSLLGRQNKESDAYLLCLLFSDDLKMFEEESYKRSASKTPLIKALFDSRRGIFTNFRISGTLGIWLPLGSNQNVFKPSPMITLGFHQLFWDSWRFDGTIALVPFVNNEPLDFRFEGRNQSTSSLVSINLGLGVTRQNQLSKKWFLDTGFSLGIDVLGTDIESSKEDADDHAVAALDIGANIALRYKLKNGRSIALRSSIHHASYDWARSLKSDVGNSFATVGLAYGF